MVKNSGEPKKSGLNKEARLHVFAKKFVIFSALIALALVVSIFIVANDTSNKTAEQSAQKACAILTPKTATSLIGESSKVAEKSTASTSSNMITSVCTYKQTGFASTGQQISLVVRSARNDDGVKANQAYFQKEKFGTSKKLPVYEKYGDKNTWNAPDGQLNILKGNTWYTLTIGGQNPSDRSLNSAGKFAEKIKNQL